ncbi:MAG: SDR family oxidoreductase, partial [bacterium]
TPLITNLPPKLIEIVAVNNPFGRIATPADVANVVFFLASNEADYLHGINIPINGGGIMV